ncbi:hypothetical protein [Turneriella parva]|uniref:Uncharacterized protein n=1 Tax=Turneriella parva (strain ATCC BAA-1111 / DSM 21527 / NCTC 11395 / H) TaxID=869212 RepID=I4B0C0_TURPD|nr:hypothetical protein [Turneriella parva]AFM10727.1 hypothetical protein Turpa_0064 [Turneriella parva DSM 21527]
METQSLTGDAAKADVSIKAASRVLWSKRGTPWDAIAILLLRIPMAAAMEARSSSTSIAVPIANLLAVYGVVRLIIWLISFRKGLLILEGNSLTLRTPDLAILAPLDDIKAAARGNAIDPKTGNKLKFWQGNSSRGGKVDIGNVSLPNDTPAQLIAKAAT